MNGTLNWSVELAVLVFSGFLLLRARRLGAFVRIPGSFFLLGAGAALASRFGPFAAPNPHVVEQVVAVALAFVLFEGGLRIGWRRLRPELVPVVALGIGGTALCVVAVAAVVFLVADMPWYQAVLVGAAVAPTDPAVVFAVFANPGQRGSRRAETILEGESGANDPVGIALLVSLVGAAGLDWHALGSAAGEFFAQLVIGAGLGGLVAVAAGRVALRIRKSSDGRIVGVPLVGVLVVVSGVFFAATAAHGSGFLAVFVAGIGLGDLRIPVVRRVRASAVPVATLGEWVAFVALGLTVDLHELTRSDVWIPGLVIAAALALVIRPVVGAGLLLGSGLSSRERSFVLLCGLKGAVPILLGLLLVVHHVPDARRLYAIVVVVVVLSMVLMGGAVPRFVSRLLERPETVHPDGRTADI